MGYTGSSQYFNRIIQKIMEDLPGTQVEVDDMLSEAATMEEVLSIFRKVLICCREKNIKSARYKLKFGMEVDFAGTTLEVWTATDQPLPR